MQQDAHASYRQKGAGFHGMTAQENRCTLRIFRGLQLRAPLGDQLQELFHF